MNRESAYRKSVVVFYELLTSERQVKDKWKVDHTVFHILFFHVRGTHIPIFGGNINPFTKDEKIVCGWRFKYAKHSIVQYSCSTEETILQDLPKVRSERFRITRKSWGHDIYHSIITYVCISSRQICAIQSEEKVLNSLLRLEGYIEWQC